MGNHGSSPTGKVVLPDGTIQCFHEPLTAAELMVEHPHQVVLDLSTSNGKPTALPADKKLEPHKLYLMLPLRRGKPPSLSSKEAHQIVVRVNAVLERSLSPTSKFLLPLFALVCPASPVEDSQRIVVARKKEEKKEDLDLGLSCDSGRWKPSLDTIKERREHMKEVSNFVVLAAKVGKRIHTKGLVWG